MTPQISNALIHKYVLKSALPLLLHDRFILHGTPSDDAIVCLSFDCENSDDMTRIPSLLDVLRDSNMTCSFAVRGDLVMAHRETIKEILTSEHEVINHTFSHPNRFAMVEPEKMTREVASFQSIMKSEFGYRPEGFRAPHLMTRYHGILFKILRANNLYDSSYVGTGIARIDDVNEIPLTACPDHPQVCFDYWHHFQLPLLRSSMKRFMSLWDKLLEGEQLINIFLDPRLVSDSFLRELVARVPDRYRWRRMKDTIVALARES